MPIQDTINGLTSYSRANYYVILNFLLYAQIVSPELELQALDYVLNDHIDGEDSEEAIKERKDSILYSALQVINNNSSLKNEFIIKYGFDFDYRIKTAIKHDMLKKSIRKDVLESGTITID